MSNQWLALGVSFLFVLGILGLSTALTKVVKVSTAVSRKIVHISVGHWIILAMLVFNDLRFLVVTPIVFIGVNYLSFRYKIFDVMEQDDDSFGTVWYAVSLFILSTAGFLLKDPRIAIIGILAMAYGDGFAALIGQKWGKHKWRMPYENKSIEGSATMFGLTFIVVVITQQVMQGTFSFVEATWISGIVTLVELMAKKGKDNLTVPIFAGGFTWFFSTQMMSTQAMLLLGFAALILSVGFIKRAITFEGCIHGIFVAFILLHFGQVNIFYGLILFFALGSLVSKVGKDKQKIERLIHERSGPRNSIQVYANAGGAVLMVILGEITGLEVFDHAALIIFIAALADTFSSEIGMLSKKQPVSIITFKKIAPGLSGGVSLLGITAALLGAFTMSFILVKGEWSEILLMGTLGFLGSLIDSLIGASIQRKYYDPENNTLTERKQIDRQPLQLVSGFKKINNDAVNFIATVLTSLIYIGIRLVL